MKKILSLTLALIMVFLFVGCASKEPKAELTRGKIEGDVYTNEFLGFQFTKPASWVYSTDEEIAAMINLGADQLGEKFKEAVENNPSVYDMMVVDLTTRSNINIGYENLSKTFASNITVEQYIDALKNQLSGVTSMKVEFPDKYDKITIGKTEFTKVVCNVSSYGISMKQAYYLHKADGYMAFIIVTAVGEYSVADIEAMFK